MQTMFKSVDRAEDTFTSTGTCICISKVSYGSTCISISDYTSTCTYTFTCIILIY